MGLFHRSAVAQVACGFFHTMFLLQSSEVFAVGRGDWGLLGMGDRMDRKLPCKIIELQVLSLTAIMKCQTSNLAAAGPTHRFHRMWSPPQVTSIPNVWPHTLKLCEQLGSVIRRPPLYVGLRVKRAAGTRGCKGQQRSAVSV